jgi:hypothetical protein
MRAARATGFIVACLMAACLVSGARGQALAVHAISGSIHTLDTFSVADQIFEHGWWTIEKPHEALLELDGKYSRFEGWIGVRDEDNRRDQKYRIALDGVTAVEGKISHGERAVHVDIDLTGVRAMRIALDERAVIGDPMLYKDAPGQAAPAAVLAEPADKARITANTVVLKWRPVDGAAAYGVEIVLTRIKGSPDGVGQRIWAVNVPDGATQCTFDLSSLPTGEYKWSVLAFGQSAVTGKFSKDRTFYVTR